MLLSSSSVRWSRAEQLDRIEDWGDLLLEGDPEGDLVSTVMLGLLPLDEAGSGELSSSSRRIWDRKQTSGSWSLR